MKPIINKITDYLYHFICDTYDFDRAAQYMRQLENSGTVLGAPACSTIRNGNYFGRNFDFVYSDLIDFVISIPRRANRYASVGVACSLGECTTENIRYGISDEVCNFLPFCVWDGINEKGVVFSTNVVPSLDLDRQTVGTNSKKPLLYTSFIGREILDHAGSAREAIELLKKRNIMTPKISILAEREDLHFMIADEQDTYVVEFINNKLVCRKNEMIMTNFYLSLPPQPHACGLERYDLLVKHYDQAGHSMKSMSAVMKKLHYSQAYDVRTSPFWYTEHLNCGLADGIDITIFNMYQYKDYIKEFAKKVSFAERRFDGPWHTTHSSIYDIGHRKLRIFSQEKYDIGYEFSLNPEKYMVKCMR